jgi:hypothetical protein
MLILDYMQELMFSVQGQHRWRQLHRSQIVEIKSNKKAMTADQLTTDTDKTPDTVKCFRLPCAEGIMLGTLALTNDIANGTRESINWKASTVGVVSVVYISGDYV